MVSSGHLTVQFVCQYVCHICVSLHALYIHEHSLCVLYACLSAVGGHSTVGKICVVCAVCEHTEVGGKLWEVWMGVGGW